MFTENVYRAADRGQKAKMTDKVSDRKRIKEENAMKFTEGYWLSLIHISEPTRH